MFIGDLPWLGGGFRGVGGGSSPDAMVSRNSRCVHIPFTAFSNTSGTKEKGYWRAQVDIFDLKSFRATELSAVEALILREKAKGLSDLEVALRLFLYPRDVRAITQKLKKRYVNGTIADPLTLGMARFPPNG
jgi:hypothetical protein